MTSTTNLPAGALRPLRLLALSLPLCYAWPSQAEELPPLTRDNAGEEAIEGGPTAAGPVGNPGPGPEERDGILALFPDLYGTVEVRHVILRQMDRDVGLVHPTRGPLLLDNKHVLSDSPHIELRPTIGSTFFQGKLDSSFTFVYANYLGTSELLRTDVINYSQWNVIDGKFNADSPYTFGPAAFTDFMNTDHGGSGFSYTDIGVFGEVNYQFPIPTGALALRGYANPSIELYSHDQAGKNKSELNRDNSHPADRQVGLADAGDSGEEPLEPDHTQQRHPLYLAFYGVSASYKPRAVRDLTLTLGLDVIQAWKPIYHETLSPGEEESTVTLAHYRPEAVSFTRFTVLYQVNKRVSLVNQLRHYTGGLWQRGISETQPERTGQVNGTSWENRLSLVLNLF